MDTIKNYLESMFRGLPQTAKVLKAKKELGQMMEDKYSELIKEGKSDNEAIGTVISEFGNLEELAADLGIDDVFNSSRNSNDQGSAAAHDEPKSQIQKQNLQNYYGSLLANSNLYLLCFKLSHISLGCYMDDLAFSRSLLSCTQITSHC